MLALGSVFLHVTSSRGPLGKSQWSRLNRVANQAITLREKSLKPSWLEEKLMAMNLDRST